MDNTITPVALEKAYRLLNHGPTVLVSASHHGVENVMAASWACPLDYAPPRLTVVLDKQASTRALLENSQMFAIQIPTVDQLQLTYDVGTTSLRTMPDKLVKANVKLFHIEGFDLPFVAGCSGWLACKLIPNEHNQNTYDLFMGDIVGAWSDPRVFNHGHWQFENAPDNLRSLHYVAGGHFYAIGEVVTVPKQR